MTRTDTRHINAWRDAMTRHPEQTDVALAFALSLADYAISAAHDGRPDLYAAAMREAAGVLPVGLEVMQLNAMKTFRYAALATVIGDGLIRTGDPSRAAAVTRPAILRLRDMARQAPPKVPAWDPRDTAAWALDERTRERDLNERLHESRRHHPSMLGRLDDDETDAAPASAATAPTASAHGWATWTPASPEDVPPGLLFSVPSEPTPYVSWQVRIAEALGTHGRALAAAGDVEAATAHLSEAVLICMTAAPVDYARAAATGERLAVALELAVAGRQPAGGTTAW